MKKLAMGASVIAIVFVGGCGWRDEAGGDNSTVDQSNIQLFPGTPVFTNSPEITEPSLSPTEAPIDISATDVPTDVPASTEAMESSYPALKADGLSWGLRYFEQGVQPAGNENVDVLEQYHAYYMGTPNDKVLYLTFDCGYENGNTEPILAALRDHDVKATFFVTGYYLETQAELLNKMVDEGHAVANHSYHHPDITTLDREALQEELDSVKNKFKEVTGAELAMYFRPPQGMCSSEAMKWTKEMGYASVFWSIAYVDWNADNQPTREAALKTILDRTHPGAIVLLHNTSQTNGEILSDLITKWKEMGYTILPLSNLITDS